MVVITIAVVIAVIVGFLFLVVVVGVHRAHPTDLAQQQPARTATVARCVVGLYVRRGAPQPQPVQRASQAWAAR